MPLVALLPRCRLRTPRHLPLHSPTPQLRLPLPGRPPPPTTHPPPPHHPPHPPPHPTHTPCRCCSRCSSNRGATLPRPACASRPFSGTKTALQRARQHAPPGCLARRTGRRRGGCCSRAVRQCLLMLTRWRLWQRQRQRPAATAAAGGRDKLGVPSCPAVGGCGTQARSSLTLCSSPRHAEAAV